MKYLTQEQYDRFQDDGTLVIDGFLTPAELQSAIGGVDRVCRERAGATRDDDGFQLEKVDDNSFDHTAQPKSPGMFRKIQPAIRIPELRDVFTSRKMIGCMQDLMGPDVYYHSSKVMFKPAHGGAAKPWHQDAAYWRHFEPRQITIWIALDVATEENGCVWAIPGSHKHGLIPHIKEEQQVEEPLVDVKKAVPVPVKPGGLLIFHSLVLHMSKKNTSDKNRRAIICDYDCLPNPNIDMPLGTVGDANGVWKLSSKSAVTV
jgi:phytanoyl-CoA hydroxylase